MFKSKVYRRILFIASGFLMLFVFFQKHASGQGLKLIDDYKANVVFGLRYIPPQNSFPTLSICGGMGGLSFISLKRRLGLNIRVNYLIPFAKNLDSLNITSYYNYYIELTYRLFYLKNQASKISLGIAKPSYYINPYLGCPYCFMHNITISVQQQIGKLNIEFRVSSPIGDSYGGWSFPDLRAGGYSLGINYTFSLQKKEK